MGAGINVNGIGWHIKTQEGVVIEMIMGFQNIPFGLTDSFLTLPFVNSRKVKRTMNECVCMSEIDVFLKRKEFVASSVGIR